MENTITRKGIQFHNQNHKLMQFNHKNIRHGSTLSHGKAHAQDHQNWSRRNFLRNLGIVGGTSMLLGKIPVSAIGASPLTAALMNSEEDRILVLVRLKGGNDGLNTIIPIFDYGLYATRRPNIRIRENETISLNNSFAIPNALGDVMPFWNEGAMRVIHNVGYPQANLSHFRSTDIWASASDANVNDTSGWLGRYLTDVYPNYLENPPEIPPAIQIGNNGSIAFNNMENVNHSVVVENPDRLREIAENGALYPLTDLPDCLQGEQLGFLRTVANSTFVYAEKISTAYDTGANVIEYPAGNPLAAQLSIVARLLKGGLGTKIYTVTLDGFDTHAGQIGAHAQLMRYLGSAMNAFYSDLSASGWADKVLSMTYSEFGRRVEQNASNGTDHGTAAPILLFGAALNGNGFIGQNPDLRDLDMNGNLKHQIDFRQVYASVLENWLCVDSTTVDMVLGRNYERLDLGFECNTSVSVAEANQIQAIRHYLTEDGVGGKNLYYTLPTSTNVRVELYSIMGQKMATLQNGRQFAGEQIVRFNPRQYGLRQGQFFYRIQADGQQVSGGVQFF